MSCLDNARVPDCVAALAGVVGVSLRWVLFAGGLVGLEVSSYFANTANLLLLSGVRESGT